MKNMKNMTRRPQGHSRKNPGPAAPYPLIFLGWLIPLLLLVIAWSPAPGPQPPAPAPLPELSLPNPGARQATRTDRPEPARWPTRLVASGKTPTPPSGAKNPVLSQAPRPGEAASQVQATGRIYLEAWPTPGTTAGDEWPEYVIESDLELD
jgi:hypothetical protein